MEGVVTGVNTGKAPAVQTALTVLKLCNGGSKN